MQSFGTLNLVMILKNHLANNVCITAQESLLEPVLLLNSFKESAFFVLSLKIKTNQLNFVIGCKAYLDALWDTVN